MSFQLVAGRVENLGARRPLLDGSIGPEGVKFASRAMTTPRAAMRGAQSTWCVKTHAQVQTGSARQSSPLRSGWYGSQVGGRGFVTPICKQRSRPF